MPYLFALQIRWFKLRSVGKMQGRRLKPKAKPFGFKGKDLFAWQNRWLTKDKKERRAYLKPQYPAVPYGFETNGKAYLKPTGTAGKV